MKFPALPKRLLSIEPVCFEQGYPVYVCSLCGGTGIVDTSGVIAQGKRVGRRNWCVCPEGQRSNATFKGKLPDIALGEE